MTLPLLLPLNPNPTEVFALKTISVGMLTEYELQALQNEVEGVGVRVRAGARVQVRVRVRVPLCSRLDTSSNASL